MSADVGREVMADAGLPGYMLQGAVIMVYPYLILMIGLVRVFRRKQREHVRALCCIIAADYLLHARL